MKPNRYIEVMVNRMVDLNLPNADAALTAAFKTLAKHVAQCTVEEATRRIVERKWSGEGTCLPCQEVSDHALRLIAMDIMVMEWQSTDSDPLA
ncbi:MAG: hypothetical protein ACI88C_000075 [Acidimicrobiales bacterium]|jgi:hypothetical protein